MKILITSPQYENVVLAYLNKKYSDLREVQYVTEDSLFFVDSNDQILMEFDKYRNKLYVSKQKIVKGLESYLKLENDIWKYPFKVWVYEKFNIDVPIKDIRGWSLGWATPIDN
jgi:hypothetical protein